MNLRTRVERIEANEAAELQTVFIGRQPTEAELAALAARGWVAVVLPDNHREDQEPPHEQP